MYSNQAILEAVARFEIETAQEMLKSNIREECENAKGNRKGYKIIESMIKKSDDNPIFKGYHTYGDKVAFLDGRRLFVSDTNMGYEKVESQFNVDNMFRNLPDMKEVEINYSELVYFIKIWGKYKKPYFFKAGNQAIGCNPKYLKDLIDYTGCNRVKVIKYNAPIYAKDMTALLLPVNMGSIDYETWYKNHIEIREELIA